MKYEMWMSSNGYLNWIHQYFVSVLKIPCHLWATWCTSIQNFQDSRHSSLLAIGLALAFNFCEFLLQQTEFSLPHILAEYNEKKFLGTNMSVIKYYHLTMNWWYTDLYFRVYIELIITDNVREVLWWYSNKLITFYQLIKVIGHVRIG